MRRRGGVAFGFALLCVAGRSHAEVPDLTAEARAVYERGTRAFDARDYALAAREFARADSLLPSNAALEAALEASLLAGDPVLAMDLVERATDRPLDPRAKNAAARARASYGARVGRVVLPCAAPTRCRATVDGLEVERPSQVIVVAPGRRTIHLVRMDTSRDLTVDVAAGQTVVVPEDAAPATGRPDERRGPELQGGRTQKGEQTTTFGKVVTWTSAGLTVAIGATTALSYLDARSKRDAFDAGACGVEGRGAPARDCAARADRGESAELRTGVLLGATGALAITTIAFLVLRPWTTTVGVDAGPDRAALVLRGPLP